MGFINVFGM